MQKSRSSELNFLHFTDSNIDENVQEHVAIHKKTNQLTEILCKAIYVVLVLGGIAILVLPRAFYSYYLYFSIGDQDTAFKLSLPVW